METISDNESDTSAIDVSTPGKSSFPSVPSKLNECSLSIRSQDPGRCSESSHVHASGYVRSKCSPERSVASKGGVRRHSLATESASGRSSPPPSEPDCDSDADDGQKEHAFLQFERGPPRLATFAAYKYATALGPTVLLLIASVAVLVLNWADALWSSVGFAIIAFLALLWQFLAGLLHDRDLLLLMAAQVSEIVACDEASVQCTLSHDKRVLFLQKQIYARSIQATVWKEQARVRAHDPMHFLRKPTEQWERASMGYTVIDQTGIILYVNSAMCRFFGHAPELLLQENVRILMPAPYCGQHDHFLKRYLETGIQNTIGTERAVPVVKADGTQAIVHLSVQEMTDPWSSQNRLFVGVMKFAGVDVGVAAFRAAVRNKFTDVPEACKVCMFWKGGATLLPLSCDMSEEAGVQERGASVRSEEVQSAQCGHSANFQEVGGGSGEKSLCVGKMTKNDGGAGVLAGWKIRKVEDVQYHPLLPLLSQHMSAICVNC